MWNQTQTIVTRISHSTTQPQPQKAPLPHRVKLDRLQKCAPGVEEGCSELQLHLAVVSLGCRGVDLREYFIKELR